MKKGRKAIHEKTNSDLLGRCRWTYHHSPLRGSGAYLRGNVTLPRSVVEVYLILHEKSSDFFKTTKKNDPRRRAIGKVYGKFRQHAVLNGRAFFKVLLPFTHPSYRNVNHGRLYPTSGEKSSVFSEKGEMPFGMDANGCEKAPLIAKNALPRTSERELKRPRKAVRGPLAQGSFNAGLRA